MKVMETSNDTVDLFCIACGGICPALVGHEYCIECEKMEEEPDTNQEVLCDKGLHFQGSVDPSEGLGSCSINNSFYYYEMTTKCEDYVGR